MRRFVADAERITTDGNGRLLLPKRYLLSAGITADVRFIGMDDTIEIWSREEAELLLEDNGDLGDGLEAMMGMVTGQPDAIHE